MRHVLALILCLWALAAHAQSPVIQYGNITPGHVACWASNGIVFDCGTAQSNSATTFGTTYPGPSICANSGPVSGPYTQMCLGATQTGGGTVSVNTYSGASGGFNFTLNGTALTSALLGSGTTGQLAFWTGTNSLGAEGQIMPAQCPSATPSTTGCVSVGTGLSISGSTLSVANPFNTVQTFANDVYMGSGRPWCDVRAHGALGNGTNDDSSAFTACQSVLAALGGGDVKVPPGIYCAQISYSVNNIRLLGSGGPAGTPQITWCSGMSINIDTIYLNGFQEGLQQINIVGPPIVGGAIPAGSALHLGGDCTECQIKDWRANGGYYAFFVQAVDYFAESAHLESSYGTAIMLTQATSSITATGGYSIRLKRDQNPGGNGSCAFPAQGTSFSNWAPGVGYTGCTTSNAGSIVILNGHWLIQAVSSGTSGNSAPTIASYNTDMPDGSGGLQWQLLAPETYYALLVGSRTFALYDDMSDNTCVCTAGIGIIDDASLGVSQSIHITSATTGETTAAGVFANDGNDLTVLNSQIGTCILPNCTGVQTANNWVGDTKVLGNTIFDTYYGVFNGAGVGMLVQGNLIAGNLQNGFFSGVRNVFSVIANDFYSPTWGANTSNTNIHNSATNCIVAQNVSNGGSYTNGGCIGGSNL